MNVSPNCAPGIAKNMLGLACLLAVSAFSAAAAPIVPPPDSDSTVTYLRVTKLGPGQVLWVRSAPSLNAQRIGFFVYNSRHIRSYGCESSPNTWCEVQYRGKLGWSRKLNLTEDTERQAYAATGELAWAADR